MFLTQKKCFEYLKTKKHQIFGAFLICENLSLVIDNRICIPIRIIFYCTTRRRVSP